MFQKVNVPVLGIVENMSYYICPQCGHREEIFKHGGGRRTAEQLKVPFLGEIPLDPKVAIGGDAGEPIVAAEPKSGVTEAYLKIAERNREAAGEPGGRGHLMPTAIELVQGDITSLSVDAIVNAANEHLQLGAGVAGAIRRKGGDSIQRECDRIGHCPVGGAVVTGGGTLPARWVIHAVGPVWRGGQAGEEESLASAVRSALARAKKIDAKSVALPAIATGIYGFPLDRAAEISIREARAFASRAGSVERVVFCLFDDSALAAFERALSWRNPSAFRYHHPGVPSVVAFLWLTVFLSLVSPPQGASPADISRLEAEKNLGLAALEEGDVAQARTRFEAVRRIAPGEPLGWADGAVAAMRARDLPEAKKLLAEASRLARVGLAGARARGNAARARGERRRSDRGLREGGRRQPRGPRLALERGAAGRPDSGRPRARDP